MTIKELLEASGVEDAVMFLKRSLTFGDDYCPCCGSSYSPGPSSPSSPYSSSSSDCYVEIDIGISAEIVFKDGTKSYIGGSSVGGLVEPGSSVIFDVPDFNIDPLYDGWWCCTSVKYTGYHVEEKEGIGISVIEGITSGVYDQCSMQCSGWSMAVSASGFMPCPDTVSVRVTLNFECNFCPVPYILFSYLYFNMGGKKYYISMLGQSEGFVASDIQEGIINSFSTGYPCDIYIDHVDSNVTINGLSSGKKIVDTIPEHSFKANEELTCGSTLYAYEDIVVNTLVKYSVCIETWYKPCPGDGTYIKGETWCSGIKEVLSSDIQGEADITAGELHLKIDATIIPPTPEHGENYILSSVEQEGYRHGCNYDAGILEFTVPFLPCQEIVPVSKIYARFTPQNCP